MKSPVIIYRRWLSSNHTLRPFCLAFHLQWNVRVFGTNVSSDGLELGDPVADLVAPLAPDSGDGVEPPS